MELNDKHIIFLSRTTTTKLLSQNLHETNIKLARENMINARSQKPNLIKREVNQTNMNELESNFEAK
jgi:hypothetical protein